MGVYQMARIDRHKAASSCCGSVGGQAASGQRNVWSALLHHSLLAALGTTYMSDGQMGECLRSVCNGEGSIGADT